MKRLDALLDNGLGTVYTAASVEIRQRGSTIYRRALGSLDPEGARDPGVPPVKRDTLFDYASLTKLFTTLAFFRLVDAGHVRLDTPVSSVLPEFSGSRPIQPYEHPLNAGEMVAVVPPTTDVVDAGEVTFKHLLTHSSGLPAWINLRRADTREDRLRMCLTTPFAYPIGGQVVYSDVGYILLGLAIAALADAPLDSAMKRLVSRPLELSMQYSPIPDPVGHVPPTEFCQWRQRRVVGEVHDENAACLGGVAGHAGLFGTAADCATLAQIFLAGGGGFISSKLAGQAIRQHIDDRGLGWMMRTSEASSSGRYFSDGSYGHTGFVGNSLWVDPARQLICALLTNNVFFGRDKTNIVAFRRDFHDAIITDLEQGGEA